MRYFLSLLLAGMMMVSMGHSVHAQRKKKKNKAQVSASAASKKEKGLKTIAEFTKKFKKQEGLFTMYLDTLTGKTYLEVGGDQLGKEFIHFGYVENGVVAAGTNRGSYRGSRIFTINKVYDKLNFQLENTEYYFDPENAISKARDANINKPVFFNGKIEAYDKENDAYLIESSSLFMGETFTRLKRVYPLSYGGFQLGKMSSSKSRLLTLKNYPENTDVRVELVFEGSGRSTFGPSEVTDGRFVSVTYQHSLIAVPENNFKPRKDDERVGYFSRNVTDLTISDATPYRDMIHRWHLEKVNPGEAVSDVVEPITWWIENTTPQELRDIIKEGAEAWNIAFEAAGYRNAMVVKVQPDDAEWDAGDIRYNVLRWTSSPQPPFTGYGPSFVNPRTGQILGADIMLEYGAVLGRLRRSEFFELTGFEQQQEEEAIWNELQDNARKYTHCTAGNLMAEQMAFARAAFDLTDSPEEKQRFLEESVKRLILHEIGHTLGLNHNMKASTLQSVEDAKNMAKMVEEGLCNSVMEYPAVNYPSTPDYKSVFYDYKPGYYDMWAIEYGYSEALENPTAEDARLEKILSRSADPRLAFGNDGDDMRSNGKGIDPMVNIYDLTDDPVRFATEQIELVEERLMPKLLSKYTRNGESFARLRDTYLRLLGHKGIQLRVISKHIGGVYVNRAVEGTDSKGRDPYTPMPKDKQEAAMQALAKYAFAPSAWEVDDELVRHLQLQRRGFNQPFDGEDPKLHSSILSVQNSLLGQLLHENLLNRITDTEQYGNQYSLSEYLNDLTDAVFDADKGGSVNSIRQNLQLSYLQRLIKYLENDDAMANTKSGVLYQINRIKAIARSNGGNQSTQAHRMHLRDMIRRMEEAK